MLFSSPVFLVFFLADYLAHLSVPARYRTYLVICASTIFYAWWKLEYAWVPFLLMAIAYWGVRWMEDAATPRLRKAWATATIVALFVPLVVFKYTDFLYRDVLGPILGLQGTLLGVPLPLGISFITFTLTAYVVDIYRRRFPGRQSASTVLAYVLFFPHLIAGPILRPHELIPQLESMRRAFPRRVALPVAIFTLGLVKKLVFADQIGGMVDAAYAGAADNAALALAAIYGFAVQIYCDFSGYTDMAIGVALMLGVRLPNNFLRPYAAGSLVDFWRRWHVTLSLWLRDYLYIPLGGNRHGRLKGARNVLITMALGGLWHGANWTFVIWGLLHGVAIALVQGARSLSPGLVRRMPRWLGLALTFHFVTAAWVLFRAPDLAAAGRMLAAPLRGSWENLGAFVPAHAFTILLIVVFFALHRFDDHRRVKALVRYVRAEILWPVILLAWVLAIAVSQGSSAKFIYFDF
ncbi:MAG: MBOAT family O-acyltransferase [Burkholderiales bacterium]